MSQKTQSIDYLHSSFQLAKTAHKRNCYSFDQCLTMPFPFSMKLLHLISITTAIVACGFPLCTSCAAKQDTLEYTLNGVLKKIVVPSQQELARSAASVVDGPKREDGSVDYLEAINLKLSQGITDENNAMLTFARASNFKSKEGLGMDRLNESVDAEFLKRLGAKSGIVPFVPFKPKTPEQKSRFNFVKENPWSKNDFPKIEEWFQLNRRSMELVRQGIELPEFYYPVVSAEHPALISQSYANYRHIRNFAEHILISGYRNLHDGRMDKCVEDIDLLFRLADFVGRGLSLGDGLTARFFYYQACQLSVSLCASKNATNAQLEELASLVEKNAHVDGLADAIDIGERWLALEVIEYLERGKEESDIPGLRLPRSYRKSIDWMELKRIVNSRYNRVAAAARMKKTAERLAFAEYVSLELNAMETQKRNSFSLLEKFSLNKSQKTQLIAGDLVEMLLQPAMLCFESVANVESRKQMTLLVIAVTRYEMENSKLPSDLSALSPKYLDTLPLDANTNEPFRYVKLPAGYRIESTKWQYQNQLPEYSVTPQIQNWKSYSGQ